MRKYHINRKGVPSLCKAESKCPLGNNEEHFSSKEKALVIYEEKMKKILFPKKERFTSELEMSIEHKEFLEKLNPSADTIRILEDVRLGNIPYGLKDNIDFKKDRSTSTSLRRHFGIKAILQTYGMYACIEENNLSKLEEIINNKEAVILDPLAGRGFLAQGLSDRGYKVIASDNNSWKISNSVEKIDAIEALHKYGNEITHVVISWAPYDTDIDYEILMEIKENYPHVSVINIGESTGGCTGSDKFWDHIKTFKTKEITHYEGIGDFIALIESKDILRRKKP